MVRSGRAAFSEGRKQYLYNGQYGVETDRDGLYYMRARYYDQDIKRFINRDVLSGDIGNSQSLNRFCYVQGNPVSLTDPFGLCPDSNVAFKKLCIGAYHLDWNALGHAALDIAGIFFQPADVVNAIWYAKEGNMKMAAASAMAVFCDATAGSKLLLGGSKFGKYQGVVNTVAHLVFGGAGVAIGSDMFMTNYENFVGGLKEGRFDVESFGNMLLGGVITGFSLKGMKNGIEKLAVRGAGKRSAKGYTGMLADWDDLNDITMESFASTGTARHNRQSSLSMNLQFFANSPTTYDINKLVRTQPYTYSEGVEKYKRQILEEGVNSIKPIPIRVHNGEALIVDGHHRYEAFRQLGYDRVPIKYLHNSQLGQSLPSGDYYRTLEQLLGDRINN